MRKLFSFISATILFSACTGNHIKKVMVYANDHADINEETKIITLAKNTSGHEHKTLQFFTGSAVQLKVKNADGEKNIDIPDDGCYIVNLKTKDTIIGGYVLYSAPDIAGRTMTQEQLTHNIDSLKSLLLGQNLVAGKSFFIPPGSSAKITGNSKAHIVEPYHRMTSIEVTAGEEPEVYRFYTINEVREMIDKLSTLTK